MSPGRSATTTYWTRLTMTSVKLVEMTLWRRCQPHPTSTKSRPPQQSATRIERGRRTMLQLSCRNTRKKCWEPLSPTNKKQGIYFGISLQHFIIWNEILHVHCSLLIVYSGRAGFSDLNPRNRASADNCINTNWPRLVLNSDHCRSLEPRSRLL